MKLSRGEIDLQSTVRCKGGVTSSADKTMRLGVKAVRVPTPVATVVRIPQHLRPPLRHERGLKPKKIKLVDYHNISIRRQRAQLQRGRRGALRAESV